MVDAIAEAFGIILGYRTLNEFLEKLKPLGWQEYCYEKGRKLILKLNKQEIYAGMLKDGEMHTVFYADENKQFSIKKDSPVKAFVSLERICCNKSL